MKELYALISCTLCIADSRMLDAGFGLFAGEEIPAGMEVFRAMPVVSAVSLLLDTSGHVLTFDTVSPL